MPDASTDRRPRPTTSSRLIGLAILVLLLAYVVLRPTLEQRFGVAPPAVPESTSDRHEPSAGGDSSLPSADREREPVAGSPTVEPTRPPAEPPRGWTDAAGGVKVSPAGLRYTPGSEEGHRLRHVLRHAEDQPDRPGLHGVFDGGPDAALVVIDQAYIQAQRAGKNVHTERQGPRTVYEVDLGRRIGYLGGQAGRQRGHPPARRVRLILEGDRVITAFPF